MSAHETLEQHRPVKAGSDRSFGLIVGGILAVIALLPLLSQRGIRWWLLLPALALLIIALVAPGVLKPLNRAWMRLGELLGAVVNPVLMAVLFFGVVVPVGFVLRLLGRDLLQLRRDDTAASYWGARKDGWGDAQSLSRQF